MKRSRKNTAPHSERCKCDACGKDPIDNEIWEAQQLAEHGFYIHVVPHDDPASPSGFNAHTHGMDLIGHPDFQITLPLKSLEYVSTFLHAMCSRVKRGQSFSHGDLIDDLVSGGFVVRLIDATEHGRPVLRLVFADKHNRVMPHDMSPNESRAQYGYSEATD